MTMITHNRVEEPGAATIEPLAVDIKQLAKIVPFAVRTLRRMDASGKLPRGFKVGGRKVWRLSDIRLWCEWGFPPRAVFEERLRAHENNRTVVAQ